MVNPIDPTAQRYGAGTDLNHHRIIRITELAFHLHHMPFLRGFESLSFSLQEHGDSPLDVLSVRVESRVQWNRDLCLHAFQSRVGDRRQDRRVICTGNLISFSQIPHEVSEDLMEEQTHLHGLDPSTGVSWGIVR